MINNYTQAEMGFEKANQELQEEIERLQRQVETAVDDARILRSALEFYAHELVWNEDSDDKGDIAREALDLAKLQEQK